MYNTFCVGVVFTAAHKMPESATENIENVNTGDFTESYVFSLIETLTVVKVSYVK